MFLAPKIFRFTRAVVHVYLMTLPITISRMRFNHASYLTLTLATGGEVIYP